MDDHLDTTHTLALLLRASGPDLDGCEVARRLRQQEPARYARILAITGSGSEELQIRAREAGCDEHLLKPLDPRLIDTLITQAAGK